MSNERPTKLGAVSAAMLVMSASLPDYVVKGPPPINGSTTDGNAAVGHRLRKGKRNGLRTQQEKYGKIKQRRKRSR